MQVLRLFSVVTVLLFLSACGEQKPAHADTLSTGNVDIAVDETYRPVIEDQMKVFDSAYPNAHVTVHYKPETECLKDFFDKKVHLVLVTRELSKEEKELCTQKQMYSSSLSLARDAVAVIVNPGNTDSILDMAALKGILMGLYKKKYTVVFDNQGSSTVRFITDSILHGQPLGPNVFAAKGNHEVVDYVAKNPDAIGFVGLGYVSDSTDPDNTGRFIKNVKVVALRNEAKGEFFLPYQAYIALKAYPLTRNLYYIHNETYPGLGTGFANFLSMERGQLIFKHANFFPLRSNIVIKDAIINNK